MLESCNHYKMRRTISYVTITNFARKWAIWRCRCPLNTDCFFIQKMVFLLYLKPFYNWWLPLSVNFCTVLCTRLADLGVCLLSSRIVSVEGWRRTPNRSVLPEGHQCNRTRHPLSRNPHLMCTCSTQEYETHLQGNASVLEKKREKANHELGNRWRNTQYVICSSVGLWTNSIC